VAKAKAVGLKNQKVVEVKQKETLAAVAGLTQSGVANKLAAAQVEIQQTLAHLTANLTEKLAVLQSVESAIELKRQELSDLRQIETTAETLDELEAEIADRRVAWEQEQEQRAREVQEREEERRKTWKRAEEEYQYKVTQERQRDADAHAATVAADLKAHCTKLEALEKTWAEREAALKAHEQEVSDLKARVEDFPDEMKKEVNKEVAIATNALKRQYETEMKLAAKDAETQEKLAEQQAAAANQTIAKLADQIADLKGQLEQAHRDVKEISAKALDSASGRSAMEAVQNVLATKDHQVSKVGKN
jgi:chromosome segregation ATPase